MAVDGAEAPPRVINRAVPMRGVQDTAFDIPAIEAVQPAAPAKPWFPPGVAHWHGAATGSWWAMVPGLDHFVEAASEEALAARVRHIVYGPAL
ncbi:hypothetical protein [Actinomadura nitritigenes]|uniref:hypothetical protein n=1 Tax=Actinomadura nitritigenes TaxID=134602 RepID=UPI003D91FA82